MAKKGERAGTPLLERAGREGTPLIIGDQALFVWQGQSPPDLDGDFNEWGQRAAAQWVRVAPDVWQATLSFPPDTYMEYGFRVDDKRVPDPLNHRRTQSGVGHTNNYFYMANGRPTPWTVRQRQAPAGRLSRHEITGDGLITGRKRVVYLYRPPTDGPVPLVVVYDGLQYLHRARLPIIVNNLIYQQQIQPIALAMVDNGGKHGRMVEYSCSESTLQFLVERLLPLAGEALNLVDVIRQPGAFSVLGASMGGRMALFTALRLPTLFGAALSQSGAFSLGFQLSVVADLAEHRSRPSPRLWLDVGRYEWLLDANREMAGVLRRAGYELEYGEYNGGHNYTSWRNDLARGLTWLAGRD
jgi:enterochelin esterase family protein